MAAKKNIIYVDWKDWESGKQFLVSQDTEVRIKRASLPIVFVPGIMGSRLKQVGGDTVWDPNSTWFMSTTYFSATGQDRKSLLIDKPLEVITTATGGKPVTTFRQSMVDHFTVNMMDAGPVPIPPKWDWLPISPDLAPEARLTKTVDVILQQGWEQIAWTFYGEILLKLAGAKFGELSRSFLHPVYACGYNWIDDNKNGGTYLANRITKIIDREKGLGRECDKVILVSHSMGGLVTRASILDDAVRAKVLGIVHGAQPATGAPAAYRRMRAGFENTSWSPVAAITTRVMGIDNSRVVPLLANCVGGLELLPTKLYLTNQKNAGWLKLIEKSGGTAELLPKSDPYEEIYRGKDFLRLLNHPEMLTPGAPTAARSGYSDPSLRATQAFYRNLHDAEVFHDALGLHKHDNTFVGFVGKGGPGTFDEIRYRYDPNQNAFDFIPDGGGGGVEVPREQGTGTDLDPTPPGGRAQFFTIDAADGSGDGTVPTSSSSSLVPGSKNSTVTNEKGHLIPADIGGAEHSDFFNRHTAQEFTIAAIRQLGYLYRYEKIHK